MRRNSKFSAFCLASLLTVSLLSPPLSQPVSAQQKTRRNTVTSSADGKLSETAMRQVEALTAEKDARTPAQQKIDSQLLYAARMQRGEEIAKGVARLEVSVTADEKGFVLVDIDAVVDGATLAKIQEFGGQVKSSFKDENAIRALIPLQAVEKIAELAAVKFIRPADIAQTNRIDPRDTGGDLPLNQPGAAVKQPVIVNPFLGGNRKPDFATRAANVRAQLTRALSAGKNGGGDTPQTNTGSRNSQGDVAHRADQARAQFGVNGAGIRVGVLSDSFNATGGAPADVTSGDLPGAGNPNGFTAPVTILEEGSGADEGRAMLQIVHDLAPGAKLYFATAFSGVASFANNIRALRQAGCDIIIDDVFYFNESPFQDAPIARAVNDVTVGPGALAGASYFSSAGNAGNLTDNTSGVWEGDFSDGGTAFSVAGGTFHDYNLDPAVTSIQNPVLRNSATNNFFSLFWSDPLGASINDYDLYVINNDGATIASASTNVQNGAQDPFEQVNVPGSSISGSQAGRRIAIFKKTAAAARFLHLNGNRSTFGSSTVPSFKTDGQTKGHSAAAAAFSTAATPAAGPNGTATPAPFNSSNVSETFSSDGPRRVFYNPDGTPITPGCFLASCNGGTVRQKPDITAADGVATTLPANSGLNPFFGTSAAAPHAGAIAALLKSANPNLTTAQIRTALTQTAIDIETPGVDRTTGVGIVDAFSSLQSINAAPQASVNVVSPVVAPANGDGDAFIERGESATFNFQIKNTGAATASNINATLTTTTPGIIITSQNSTALANAAPGATASPAAPFRFTVQAAARSGVKANFALSVTFNGGVASPEVYNFTVQTGQPSNATSTTGYAGAPVFIPDPNADGSSNVVQIPFNVSNVNGTISNVKFRFDGTSCNATAGSTTVGLDHTYVGDLVIRLVSPSGTVTTLANSAGGAGINFCNTVFDDAATASIQAATASQAPFTGSFRPASPLANFSGEDANGTWTLVITDIGPGDTGNVRAFSLLITPFDNSIPSAAGVSIGGRISTPDGRSLKSALVTLTAPNGETKQTRTGLKGRYQFDNVSAGKTYLLTVHSKRYRFEPRAISVTGEETNFNLVASQ